MNNQPIRDIIAAREAAKLERTREDRRALADHIMGLCNVIDSQHHTAKLNWYEKDKMEGARAQLKIVVGCLLGANPNGMIP
jgi:hypothetical protein